MKIKAHRPGRGRRERPRPRKNATQRSTETELLQKLRALENLVFRSDGFGGELFGPGRELPPDTPSQQQRERRQRADVADLRVPFAAIKERAPPYMGERRALNASAGTYRRATSVSRSASSLCLCEEMGQWET